MTTVFASTILSIILNMVKGHFVTEIGSLM
jgi:hypothetical protein